MQRSPRVISMRAIAELRIDSNICLPDKMPVFTMTDPKGLFEVKIRNNPDATPFAPSALMAEMAYEVEDLDQARDQALDNMAPVLNALCCVVGARFDYVTVLRAFDATPGLDQREGRYYGTQGVIDSVPALEQDYANTAQRFMNMHDDEVSQSVMRWYRLGRRASIPDEQFMYLWFALEIAAEALKETGKVGYSCPACSANMFCQNCNSTPMHRRFSTDAIKDLICKVAPHNTDGGEFYKTLSKIRNTLQHGRRFDSVADTLPCTMEQAINVLANIAWRAISLLADHDADPSPDEPLTLVRIEDVPNGQMVVAAVIQTKFLGGDPKKPQISDAPHVDISMRIDGKGYTFDGQLIEE